jgi:predicted metalloprotease with PDZ domain
MTHRLPKSGPHPASAAALAALFFALTLTSMLPATGRAATPVPLDTPYPGTLTLAVDLRDAVRKIFHVHETIPVSAGPLVLHYPKWIPGEHSPSGTIDGLTGLKISSGGQTLAWHRDRLDMFNLMLEVPPGAQQLDLDFQFLSPTGGGEFGQSVSATPKLLVLEWNQVAFYPAGHYASRIIIQPKALLPEAWHWATALEPSTEPADGWIHFKPVSFDEFVDSPLMAGAYFKRLDLAPGAKVPVHLDLVADRPAELEVTDAQLAAHRALITQAVALYGSQHYDHYDFLFTLSDNVGHFGLEHHQSSDDRIDAEFFTDPDSYLTGATLLPHEYTHSWNGKFRRPADLWTPNFNVPMQDDLLWVYEGLTEYLSYVLAARAGLWTPEQFRDALAGTASSMALTPGRSWRPLQDTADEAQVLYYTPEAWSNWRRSVDFYPEGLLIWLDADTKIRELSGGTRTLDDFVRAFYGVDDGSHTVKTYGFDDVVAALNAVAPFDWAHFLRQRLDATTAAPLNGLTQGGWELSYTDTPTPMFKSGEKRGKVLDLMASLGLLVSTKDGRLIDVLWGGPAFQAGLAPGMKLVAVNGEKFAGGSPELLPDAIKAAARAGQPPIELLTQNLDLFSTVKLVYHGGPKYPHLVRLATLPDRLDAIAQPRK